MEEERKSGLGAGLRRAIDGVLGTAQTRLELLAVEAQEEKLRVTSLLFNAILAALLTGFGLLFVAAFITVLLWETHRLLALGVGSAAFLGGAVLAGRNAARELQSGSRLFAASLAELARDRDAVQRRE